MIYMNESMEKSYDSKDDWVRDIANKIVRNIKIVHDCLIYDSENDVSEEHINFDRILEMFGDKTGYEASCNEIRLDEKEYLNDQLICLMNEIDRGISERFSKKVVIYIQKIDDSIELRLHTLRENEKKWLSDRLDEYENPIMCHVSGRSSSGLR